MQAAGEDPAAFFRCGLFAGIL
ncbi:hypothetical protein CK3_31940 [butyrate-producing bacterium SS3/4]|nr:hypothetical protein CK3_31940 [butyrate-producing bacterium SS3/4]